MAIDLFTERAGLDRNKYYKSEYVDKMKLVKDAKVQGVFYSKDEEPRQRKTVINGSSKTIQTTIKIKTYDSITDLEPDHYVLYAGDNQLYIVDGIVNADVNDEAKPFNRGSQAYIISLRR